MKMSCSIAFRMISSRPSVTSSLPCSFAPQGLFCPGLMHLYLAFLFHRDYFGRPNASLSGFSASQGLFCPSLMHLYLAFLFHRDYFGRPDSSLSDSFAPQGLFCPGRIHLYLAFLFHGDYFGRPDSSLSGSFVPQGLFQPPGFISIWIFCSTGIISAVRIHLYQAFLAYKWHTSFIFSAAFVQILDIKKPETLKIQGFRLVEMTGIENN